jgi:acyl-CoA-dependent ceramide synthase
MDQANNQIWNYFRNYQNFRILKSVWYEWYLIPEENRQVFAPFSQRQYMPPWMRYQIFVPIMLLLFINLFWTVLIMRILVR